MLLLGPTGNYDNDRGVGRYCIGCGYHLFGEPELERASTHRLVVRHD